ncbi:MAG: caspase family protein [Chloroflexota bacterium]
MASQLYALLVGIDRYDNPAQAPHLRGCVADVEGTYRWLTQQMSVPQENVLLLTSRMNASEPPERRATRANIIHGWQTHLMQAGPGDQVFFNYSGHGARARAMAPENASGYDESLVPCDSRTPNVYDLIDQELALLIEAVEKKGAQVTIFLDCCHSGSGTRQGESTDENQPRVRKCASDERVRPMDTLVAGVKTQAGTRSTKAPSGWIPLGNHVLLAGCRDEELSYEYQSPETGQWQGATTYFFHQAMTDFHPNMTWSDVHDIVQVNVHKEYPAQTPQLEGPGNMRIFGGIGQEPPSYYLVEQVDGEHFVKLNVGITSGLSLGSQLAIYPPESNLMDSPIATAEVEEVRVDHLWAKLDSPAVVELASRVKVTGYSYTDQTLGVGVADAALRKQLMDADSGFLRILNPDEVSTVLQYRVIEEAGQYVVLDGTEVQVINERPPATEEGVAQLIKLLEHLAIYNNAATLQNPSSVSRMAGAVTIDNPVTYTEYGRRGPIDPTPLRTSDSGNQIIIQSGESVYFTIKNQSDTVIYLALLEFTPDFAINRVYPGRARYQQVGPQKEIAIDFQSVTLDNPRLAQGRYLYKVLATAEPTEFDALELPPLNQPQSGSNTRAVGGSALAQLMNSIRHDGTRGATLRTDPTEDEWTTAQLVITVAATAETVDLTEGETSASLITSLAPITITKPANLSGRVSVGPLSHTTRSSDSNQGAAVPPPPGMDNPDASSYFQPVTVGATTRTTRAAPLLLTIESEADQLAAVSPDTPLQLEMAVEADPTLRGILPIAYDGESYYVIGSSQEESMEGTEALSGTRSAGTLASETLLSGSRQTFTVNIDYLPPHGASSEGDPDELAQSRGLIRTARLFFYKVFLKELPEDTGLRKAELSPEGKAVYAPMLKENMDSSVRKVALMVHGITADTRWLVEKVWPKVTQYQEYDLCLAYDYESFGTGIKDNSRILYQALTELGFGANDELLLDIYAHSMGSLVSRGLVELCGGDQFVDRVFMGGPPNAGSPLAKLRGFVPWLGSVMVNQIGIIPASMLLSWSLKRVVSTGVGLADLDPEADFYDEINRFTQETVTVPYFIQIGNNEGAYESWNRIFRSGMKLADRTLDVIFAGEHDLAVGLNSACSIQSAKWPNAKIEVLGTNHFGYFYTQDGWAVLEKWLQEIS